MQTEQSRSCCERLLEKEKLGSGELKKIIKHFVLHLRINNN
jgi:hypothetical protein